MQGATTISFLLWSGIASLVAVGFLTTMGIVYHRTSSWRQARPYSMLAMGVPLLILSAFALRINLWLSIAIGVGATALGWLWATIRMGQSR